MKQLQWILLVFVSLGVAACVSSTHEPEHRAMTSVDNQFQKVWDQVKSDPTVTLPQETVSFKKLFSKGKNIILGDAKRTLNDHADILPAFNKLAHPNGVCFKGIWNISAENEYSGYFKKNSKALIIVRASSAMSNTHSGEIRSFGFAGKLFPTTNPLQLNHINTANFFLIDDLGGTMTDHYTDVMLTNEPSVSKTSEVFKSLLYVLKLARTFAQVDKNPTIRQVYEISELGESIDSLITTPKWMKVEAKAGQAVNASDFRDELRIDGNKLVFDVSVASKSIGDKKDWKTIGTITLDSSVVSQSCDHRLHFHHPKWKSE